MHQGNTTPAQKRPRPQYISVYQTDQLNLGFAQGGRITSHLLPNIQKENDIALKSKQKGSQCRRNVL